MPYISQTKRERAKYAPADAGELNFALSCVLIDYAARKGPSYQTYNDILGAVDGCLTEFKTRVLGPFEKQAIERNGDIYGH
jgi:hypothetical protein